MDNRKVIKPQLIKRRHSFPFMGVRHDITTCLPLDRDSTHDLMGEIFRHPVIASDSRKYEAATFLILLKRGARSPFIPNHTFDRVIYDLQLKVDLDRYYGDHRDRCADYDVKPVMEEIMGWMRLYNDKLEPIDLNAQQQFLPDEEDVPVVNHPAPLVNPEPNAPRRRLYYLPSVSLWPQRCEDPILDVMTKTFLVSELALLLSVLPLVCHGNEELHELGGMIVSSFFFSAMIAVVTASTVGLCNIMHYEEGDAERLHM